MLKGKKKLILLTSMCVIAVAAVAAISVYLTRKDTEPVPQPVAQATPEPVPTPEITPVPTKDPNEGKVKSALTGEYISKKKAKQRPFAVIIDRKSVV